MRKIAFPVTVCCLISGCQTVGVDPDATTPSKTFSVQRDFKSMGNCVYSKVVAYWSAKNPAASFPKVDLSTSTHFEARDNVPYAPREWMISVNGTAPNAAEVRLYEGPRGIFGHANGLYDSALPSIVAACTRG